MNTEAKTLFDIERKIDVVLTKFADSGDGVDPEREEAFLKEVVCIMEELSTHEKDKIDAYGHFVTKLESESNRIASIIKNLSARKKSVDCKTDSVKSHLKYTMTSFGKAKIEGNVYTAWLRSSNHIEIFDEAAIPEEYLRIKKEPDKTAITDAIKKGTVVPGAKVQTSQSVTIK